MSGFLAQQHGATKSTSTVTLDDRDPSPSTFIIASQTSQRGTPWPRPPRHAFASSSIRATQTKSLVKSFPMIFGWLLIDGKSGHLKGDLNVAGLLRKHEGQQPRCGSAAIRGGERPSLVCGFTPAPHEP